MNNSRKQYMAVDSKQVALSLVCKLVARKRELEQKKLSTLTPALVREWQELQRLERQLIQ